MVGGNLVLHCDILPLAPLDTKAARIPPLDTIALAITTSTRGEGVTSFSMENEVQQRRIVAPTVRQLKK